MKELFSLKIGDVEIKIKKDYNNNTVIELNRDVEEKLLSLIKKYIGDDKDRLKIIVKEDEDSNDNSKDAPKSSILPKNYFEESKSIIEEIRQIVKNNTLPMNILEKLKIGIDIILNDIEKKRK